MHLNLCETPPQDWVNHWEQVLLEDEINSNNRLIHSGRRSQIMPPLIVFAEDDEPELTIQVIRRWKLIMKININNRGYVLSGSQILSSLILSAEDVKPELTIQVILSSCHRIPGFSQPLRASYKNIKININNRGYILGRRSEMFPSLILFAEDDKPELMKQVKTM